MLQHVEKKIINRICANETSRISRALGEEVGANFKVLLLHTEVRWFLRGKVFNRLLQLREETILLEKVQNTKGVLMHYPKKSNNF